MISFLEIPYYKQWKNTIHFSEIFVKSDVISELDLGGQVV